MQLKAIWRKWRKNWILFFVESADLLLKFTKSEKRSLIYQLNYVIILEGNYRYFAVVF